MRKIIQIVLLFGVFIGNSQKYVLEFSKSTLQISGTSTVSDWTVTAEKMTGGLSLENGEIADLEISLPVSDIKSERGATMDNKMYTALKSEANPHISFILKGKNNTSTLTGDLSIAGISKLTDIAVDYKIEGGSIHIKGRKPLKLKDFEIPPPSAMFGQIVVGEEVFVIFDLYFLKK